MFDPHGSGLDECMVMVVRFPVSFVAVPIFVIPIVVTAIVVRSDRERGANYCPEG